MAWARAVTPPDPVPLGAQVGRAAGGLQLGLLVPALALLARVRRGRRGVLLGVPRGVHGAAPARAGGRGGRRAVPGLRLHPHQRHAATLLRAGRRYAAKRTF